MTNSETPTRVPEAVTAEGTITMYGLTKLVNQAGVKALGAKWANVREQHLYNYRKNGMVKVATNGKATTAQAQDFVTKFVARRVAKLGS
jgi:hypothetical protein